MHHHARLFALFCFVFRDKVSLCNSSGCLGNLFVDQAGLNLTEIPPASASQVLGLEVCATTTWLCFVLKQDFDLLLTCIVSNLGWFTHP